MAQYLAAVMVVLLVGTVAGRVVQLRRTGTQAMHFGKLDKTDYLIPPVALFYFYTVFAAAFGWPLASHQRFFHSPVLEWLGVALCLAGLGILVLSLVSFGKSFRVGIDAAQPGRLVTTGVFARSRNPIYVGFFVFLVGQLLVFPNWVPLIYLVAATALFHRQVLREEEFMRQRYGHLYADYCRHVRRYV
ncbi:MULTISPECIES: isoprenylcysteine carboxylmethyltransferase family protein [unclassified Mycobacterium]|uniref:methyltransferase family protein n=1 Tax=unclassified Mycobacterium TaxID=2642494 RepID=UPI0007FD2913|nr:MULTISPECIES: isoprenylcysteine carboxylmethyltransferase family protein [unclassified Mycobacterium]OBH04587.1 isoprenylcysteine carboxyl methyltransferase [Mycobacterium sp. E2699]OBI54157.1 isoprenylcysteine carboxyl methyltransferase [Mycobacterium sp. E787]